LINVQNTHKCTTHYI